ncbi:MAG: flippase-like domain-containing protein [Crenarchaeota archaeon]|nr:flippase-like domain-containing protein [Thermoproteota archaeon]
MNIKEIKISKKTIVLVILVVTTVMIIYNVITEGLKPPIIKPLNLVVALVVFFTAWLISAIRLRIIHASLDPDKVLPLKEYLYARLLGGLMAYITPSAIGGEPARAYYLSYKCNERFSKYFALVIYEVLYDIFVTSIGAIIGSLLYLPLTIPIIIVGIANTSFWGTMYLLLQNMIDPEKAPRIIKFMAKIVNEQLSKRLGDSYTSFASSFKTIVSRMKITRRITVCLLTITFQLLFGFTIYVLGFGAYNVNIADAIIAYFLAITASALPTPGGAGTMEYGLSITLPPGLVILSRSFIYYVTIAMGIIVLYHSGIKEIIERNNED